MKKISPVLAILLIVLPFISYAQKLDTETIAKKYLLEQKDKWQLSEDDFNDIIISDQYKTQHNGVTHIYFMQRHQGIALYNAIAGVHLLKDDTPFYVTNNFSPELAKAVNTTQPLLSAEDAIAKAVGILEIENDKIPNLKRTLEEHSFLFDAPSISNSEIKVQLLYQKVNDTEVRLAWDLAIDMINGSDYWSLRIDALTGELLDKSNYTVYCTHDHRHNENDCNELNYTTNNINAPLNFNPTTETYDVFPFPVESPVHGERTQLVNPADAIASPFGWHDTNGQEGAEYTITRGNNVHAFQDIAATDRSQGDEPDGDSLLIFDFPFDPSLEPDTYTEFATVQLFYANNYMHDFVYAYGMDEVAGSFQQRNYTGVSGGGDYVLAQAQDGSGTNNANFGTPPDGGSGTMQMFLFNRNSGNLTVDAPGSVAGVYETRGAEFGPAVDTIPISGEVVLVNDGTNSPSLGCNPIQNDLTGKIAMIDRGDCFFTEKVFNAEQQGAIAAVICNFDGGALPGAMGAGTDDPITIPSVMLDFPDCQRLKEFLGQGLELSLVLPDLEGPVQVDGTLDNGIIAHEYGHGISNRLTGGPSQAGCLFTDEQMGEGWSDFFSMVTTVSSASAENRIKTIGSYAVQQDPTGSGFRRAPYSPDFGINSQTYHDIISTTAPHPLGEVWVVTLWDLYWAMVDQHGFDEDLVRGTGGNNMAVQLVIDGMKLQACEPGFIDGRDAILAADRANYGGQNQCLIWEVFSRRGLGFEADQRSNTNRNDAKEDFSTRPDCVKELKIEKTVTPLIQGGDLIDVTLVVTNHKDSLVGEVDFYDLFPEGTSFSAFTDVPEGVVASAESDQVLFKTINLTSGSSVKVSYQLSTDANRYSVEQFKDDMENGDDNWDFFPLDEEAFLIWEIIEEVGVEESSAWIVGSSGEVAQDQVFQFIAPFEVSGTQPVLSFAHRYETEWGYDGGIVQVTTDGSNWETVEDLFFRNGYETRLSYFTISIPRLQAFAGDGEAFRTSYIDLSKYIGQEINVRFRFGADAAEDSYGWTIDDVEIFDMVNYNSEACVTSDQGDLVCTTAEERGTIVSAELPLVSTEEQSNKGSLKIFPNPANDFAHLTLESPVKSTISVRILGVDGKLYAQQQTQVQIGYNYLPLQLAALADGFYFVEIKGDFGTYVEKLVID